MSKLPLSLALGLALTACAPEKPPVHRDVAVAPPAREPVAAAASGTDLTRDGALELLCRVLAERDADCDRRITRDDDATGGCKSGAPGCAAAGRWPYAVKAGEGSLELASAQEAAQLVQELVVGLRSGLPTFRLDFRRVKADPATYLKARIENSHWDALTRRIDAEPERLLRAAADEKLGGGAGQTRELCAERRASCPSEVAPAEATPAEPRELFVYYPERDELAARVFAGAGIPGKLTVLPLPEKPTAAWVEQATQSGKHGLLTLALAPDGSGRPFVVPGGRFNEMYGWDSFFIVWGLVQDPRRVELARAMVDNHAYEISHYGKILNANRTYYLTRSQPPFLTSAISEVWRHLPASEPNRRWLERVLSAAILEYEKVWSAPPRRLGLCDGEVCLARYFGEGRGEPPEVEPGHFDWLYQRRALESGRCRKPGDDAASRARFLDCVEGFRAAYRAGKRRDAKLDAFFVNDRCVRESGHDTTFRWFSDGDERCSDFATVDLNSLLFKAEVELATLVERALGGSIQGRTAREFCARAEARARLVRRYLWDAERGLFFDYDTLRKRRSDYVAATTLYPLWASTENVCGASLVTKEMAAALKTAALAALEAPGGLYATAPSSLSRVAAPEVVEESQGGFAVARPGRQWEAPSGWAPHQMLAWTGLTNAGFAKDAERLTYKWLFTIVENAADYHGTVPEKFDVARRSHAVFAEYGNVNTQFSYIAEEGFGWMNASFVVGHRALPPELRQALGRRIPPEHLANRLTSN